MSLTTEWRSLWQENRVPDRGLMPHCIPYNNVFSLKCPGASSVCLFREVYALFACE